METLSPQTSQEERGLNFSFKWQEPRAEYAEDPSRVDYDILASLATVSLRRDKLQPGSIEKDVFDELVELHRESLTDKDNLKLADAIIDTTRQKTQMQKLYSQRLDLALWQGADCLVDVRPLNSAESLEVRAVPLPQGVKEIGPQLEPGLQRSANTIVRRAENLLSLNNHGMDLQAYFFSTRA